MNTTENNKLIRDFMGDNAIELNVPFVYEIGDELMLSGKLCNHAEDAEIEVRGELSADNDFDAWNATIEVNDYHNSWNRIMPVVEKITSLEEFDDYDAVNHANTALANALISTDINAAYSEIVDFINWYNQNK